MSLTVSAPKKSIGKFEKQIAAEPGAQNSRKSRPHQRHPGSGLYGASGSPGRFRMTEMDLRVMGDRDRSAGAAGVTVRPKLVSGCQTGCDASLDRNQKPTRTASRRVWPGQRLSPIRTQDFPGMARLNNQDLSHYPRQKMSPPRLLVWFALFGV